MATAQTATPTSRQGLNGVLDNNVTEKPALSALWPSGRRVQYLVDTSLGYLPQGFTSSQFATLRAIASLLRRAASGHLAPHLNSILASSDAIPHSVAPSRAATDLRLGLDELETITRTRAGYAFTELPPELQEAVLSLVASRDLTTGRLDLALWLDHLLRRSLSQKA